MLEEFGENHKDKTSFGQEFASQAMIHVTSF